MATNYPTSLDDNTNLPNPGSNAFTNSPSHASQHDTENDAIKALEAKVGTGASTPSVNLVLRSNGTGTSVWGSLNLATDVTGILSVSNGGTGASTLTGLVKGNGMSAFTAAVSGTDYAPATSGSGILKGNGSGGFSTATAGTDYTSPSSTDTFSGAKTFNDGKLVLAGATSGTTTLKASAIASGTLTLPAATDTLIGRATTDTLTNKTLTTPTIDQFNNASGLGAAWSSWVPTWTNLTTGNGILTYAKYIQIGKTVHFRLHFVLGTTSAVSGAIVFSLPVNLTSDLSAFTNRGINGLCEMRHSGTSQFGMITINSSTTATPQPFLVSGTSILSQNTSSTAPFTWASGDIISMSGVYEGA